MNILPVLYLRKFSVLFMKISFIATVYNEEKSIYAFLNSLFTQNYLPSQIVIVDAYSKDNTYKILKEETEKFSKKNRKTSILLFKKKGNRSVGRNFAILNAKHTLIAASDAGCILDKNWLKEISDSFEDKSIDVVAGFYRPVTKNVFEKCLSTYTCVMDDRLNKDFLPSSRSIGFKKTAWQQVGGYPENLDTCEDLMFARNLKKNKFKFKVVKKAFVHWPQEKNMASAFLQFYSYAKGDGKARYIRFQTPLLFIRFLFFLFLILSSFTNQIYFYLLLLFFMLYFVWAIVKNYKYVGNKKAFLYLPMLQIISDIAVFYGTTAGLLFN